MTYATIPDSNQNLSNQQFWNIKRDNLERFIGVNEYCSFCYCNFFNSFIIFLAIESAEMPK
jgi:hypothetical protein